MTATKLKKKGRRSSKATSMYVPAGAPGSGKKRGRRERKEK